MRAPINALVVAYLRDDFAPDPAYAASTHGGFPGDIREKTPLLAAAPSRA